MLHFSPFILLATRGMRAVVAINLALVAPLPAEEGAEILPPATASSTDETASPKGLTITTVDGKTYENVRISRTEADGLVLIGEGGIIKVPFAKLPEDVQREYGYDPAKAAEFKARQAEIQAQVAKSGQAARAVAEEREKSDLAAMEADKQKRQKEAELRGKMSSAVRIDGKVLQATNEGLLVNCDAPEPVFTYGMQSIGGGAGPKKTSTPQTNLRPQPAYGRFLLVGHPNQASIPDQSRVDVDAYEDGLFAYTDTTGAQRRVKKFVVIRVVK